MRGRIVVLVFLLSSMLLINFGAGKPNVESRVIEASPTKTPLPNNKPADVESVAFDKEAAPAFCPYNSEKNSCGNEKSRVKVTATIRDEENDVVIYEYKVSAGRIVGQGASVWWDFSGVEPGIYTIEVRVDDGCGFCGKSVVRTFELKSCPDCQPKND